MRNEKLIHHGIKGQKWGVRSQERATQREEIRVKKFLNTFGALTIGPLMAPIATGTKVLGIVSPTVRKELKEQKRISKERNEEQKVKYNKLAIAIPNGNSFVKRYGLQ